MAARRGEPYRILLPLANPRTARDLVRIGSGISRGRRTEITALGIVEVPEGVSLAEGATHARTARRLLQRVLDFGDEEEIEIRTMVRIGRRAADGVIEAVGEEGSDLVIFGWGGPPTPAAAARSTAARGEPREAAVFSPTIDAVVRESPCDIAVVKQRGIEEVNSILVPVRGGPHAELAMRLARDLGKRFGAQVVVMHVVPSGIGERAMQREREALDRFVAEHGGGRKVKGLLREAPSVRTAILREANNHQLLVMGASAHPSSVTPDGRFLFGVVAETVAARAKPTVIVVKTKVQLAVATFEELRAAEGTLAAADAYVERSRPADHRRPLVRGEHVPRGRIPRRDEAGRPQGEAGPDDQPGASGPQRGSDHRAGHPTMGMTQQQLARLEAGGNPTLSTLSRVAEGLGRRVVVTLEKQSEEKVKYNRSRRGDVRQRTSKSPKGRKARLKAEGPPSLT